jgi:hypothetical protein
MLHNGKQLNRFKVTLSDVFTKNILAVWGEEHKSSYGLGHLLSNILIFNDWTPLDVVGTLILVGSVPRANPRD